MLRLYRSFAYRPSYQISFDKGKALLVSNDEISKYSKLISSVLTTIPAAFVYRLVTRYSDMGWINFLLSSSSTLALLTVSKTWFEVQAYFAQDIYLLEDGEHIEVHTPRLWNYVFKVKISDIQNPEENLNSRLKMQAFGTYLIETTRGEIFYFIPESTTYYPDVLKEVIKGNPIDLSKDKDESSNEFIDI